MQGMLQLTVFLLIVTTCSCQVLVVADPPSATIPSTSFPLSTATVLSCGIVNAANFTGTWTTPNDGVITPQDLDTMGSLGHKYNILNTPVPGFQGGSILLIRILSYLDSGTYTCSISFTDGENAGITESDDIELSLLVEAQASPSAATGSVGGEAGMNCLMSGYIRPDADLQWRRGEEMITANDKYSITYIEGIFDAAVNGVMVSSRFTILTISDVKDSDEGTYTCFVQGTDAEASVQLSITGSITTIVQEQFTTDVLSDTTTISTFNPTPTTTTFSITTVIIATSSAAVIVLVLLSLIVAVTGICVALYIRKKTDIHETPAGGSTHPHFSISNSMSTPDVMTQNSAYGTIASADATDSKVPDVMTQNSYGSSASTDARDNKISGVMTQNSAYGQISTANDGNQEYDYISV